jgi:hypothetical protein
MVTPVNNPLYIQYTATNEIAQSLIHQADDISAIIGRLRRAAVSLQANGIQGTFAQTLDTRCAEILNRLQYLCAETSEAGRDLFAVVEIARQLDAQCAARFDTYSSGMIAGIGIVPVAAGSAYPGEADRLIVIDESILKLRRIQESLQTHIADIDHQLQNKVESLISSLFGYSYEEMKAGLVDSLHKTEARIDELLAERAQLEHALSAPSPLSQLMGPLPRAAMSAPAEAAPVMTEASSVSPSNLIGRAENLQSPARRQYEYKYPGKGNDRLACALYAQAGVMEAMGHNFDVELAEARTLGMTGADGKSGTDDDWFSETGATEGLGQPFAANNIPYETYWGLQPPEGQTITRDIALGKLKSELEAGHYPVLSFDARQLSDFSTGTASDKAVKGHAAWIVGLQLNEAGEISHVIANDSHWGAIKYYPVDEFLNAWGHSGHDYYAVFAQKPD